MKYDLHNIGGALRSMKRKEHLLTEPDGRGSIGFAAAEGRVDVCRYLLEELDLCL
ncbi:hypothetical protein C5167_031200 [Papaver somniferum]|nr:hypothetical protein C5167_031200 [Papaver somniferum]